MKHLSKTFLWTMSTLLLLLGSIVIGIAVLYMLINPNTLFPKISAIVEEKTGYQIKATGKISMGLYPLLGLTIDELHITKPTQTEAFVVLKHISLSSPWQIRWNKMHDWHVTVRASEVFLQHIHMSNLKTNIILEKEAITLDQLTAELYQGTLNGHLSLKQMPERLSSWQLDIMNVNMLSLLKDLQQSHSGFTLSGLMNAHFIGQANLRNDDVIHAMDGTIQFDMQTGALLGIDLNYFMDKGIALLRHQKSDRNNTKTTTFKQLDGSIHLANGMAKTENIRLQADTFTARIMGDMQLDNQALDISLQITPKNETRLTIPLLISGTVTKPSISIDTLLIQAMLTKEEIEKINEKVDKELKKLPERANQLLDKLFGT